MADRPRHRDRRHRRSALGGGQQQCARRPVRVHRDRLPARRGNRAARRRARDGAPRDRLAAATGGRAGAALRPLRAVHPRRVRPCRHAGRELLRHADHRRGWHLGPADRRVGQRGRDLRDLRRRFERRRGGTGLHEPRLGRGRATDRRRGQGLGAVLGTLRIDLGLGLGERRLDGRDHPAGDDQAGLPQTPRRGGRGGGVLGRTDHAAAHGGRRLRHGRADGRALHQRHGGGGPARSALLPRGLGRDQRLCPPVRAAERRRGRPSLAQGRGCHLDVLRHPLRCAALGHVRRRIHAGIRRGVGDPRGRPAAARQRAR